MKLFFCNALLLLVSLFPAAQVSGSDSDALQEIVVTATFHDLDILKVPASMSVIDAATISGRAAQHLEEVLNAAPNVNFAAGASRGRYLQIRGIGERSQFVDPINPSVGVVLDGIDVSAIGNAATLYDIQQVEVLRGPQGTRFGANGLAGMVNILSNEPTEEFVGALSSNYGNYGAWSLGSVVSGPLADTLLGRLAVQQYRGDGFIENDFVRRDNTNNRDELTARGKLRWLAHDDLTVDVTTLYVNVDNGYDGFSLDNTRHTLSDQPGQDRQETSAVALTDNWTGHDLFELLTRVTYTDSSLEYGYDEDWSFNGLCTGSPCEGWEYSSTDNYQRERDATRVEVRLTSTEAGRLGGHTDWVTGVYYEQRDETLQRNFFDWVLFVPDAEFTSAYDTDNLAVYGQIATLLSERVTLTLGARWEQFQADYRDSRAVRASPQDDLWGGQASLEFHVNPNTMLYGLIARGYKTGGVNGEALGRAKTSGFGPSITAFLQDRLEFDRESLINYELGVKGSYLHDRLQTRIALFYMDRQDVQLKGWYNEGQQFVEYIDNAASGKNYGMEMETRWQLSEALQLFANIGWLDTEIDDFVVNVADTLVDKSGREQAHAPGYQFNLGARVDFSAGFYARLEVEGKDRFYFSDSHDQQSDSYELVNATLGYNLAHWDVTLWGRNLTDQDYAVRGFYFGNDPRKFYADEAYYQYGEPRVFGATATYNF